MQPAPPQKRVRGDPVWFRLLTPLPLTATLATAVFTLHQREYLANGLNFPVDAKEEGTAHYAQITEKFRERGRLELALYTGGFAVRHALLCETILWKLVRDGHAEHLAEPHQWPTWTQGWPWAWLPTYDPTAKAGPLRR